MAQDTRPTPWCHVARVYSAVTNKTTTHSEDAGRKPARSTGKLVKFTRRRLRQFLAAAAVNISSFANGVSMAWASPMLSLLQSEVNPVGTEPMTDMAVSWLSSLICIGALHGIPFLGPLCNRYSRKMTGYLIAISGIIGWILIMLASTELMLFVSRFPLRVASAGVMMLCPLYIAEIVEVEIRGTLCSYLVIFTNCGILFPYLLGSAMPYRQFCLCCLATSVTIAFAFVWLPESPVYLTTSGHHIDALKASNWLWIYDGLPTSHPNCRPQDTARLKNMLLQKGMRRALLVGIGLMVNNQFSGTLAVLSYTVTIYQESGSQLSPNISTILVSILQLFGVYLTFYFVDRAGRKVSLITSNIIMATSLALLEHYFHLKSQGVYLGHFGWLPVTCLCVYVVGVALGIGSVHFIVIGEILPSETKGLAIAISLWSLVASLSSSHVLGLDICLGLFALCCIASAFFSYYVVPETKNKSLETIIQELNGHVISRDTHLEVSNSLLASGE